MTRRVCFVTDELHPFTQGGIGRLIHNLVQQGLEASAEAEFHIMAPASVGLDPERVRSELGERVTLHSVAMRVGWAPALDDGEIYPPAAAFSDAVWHAESLDFLRALKQLGREGVTFDVIEFPDYKGWAFCTLQEKLLGLDFERTLVAVRLHTTDGILQRFEPRTPTLEQAGGAELERKALHDAELVVAHLPAVAEFNRVHYEFEESWASKVVVQFPPVVWGAVAQGRTAPAGPRDLLFPTKLQAIKQPELFVRGAVTWMRRQPQFTGVAVLACHTVDDAYTARIRGLVPPDLASRFRLVPPGPERDERMRTSTVVLSSAYEGCNLTAYEAAAAGAVMVVNGACVAFGDRTPFVDGVNCHKFDGTVEGLAAALERAWSAPPPERVAWRADRPYWLDGARPPVGVTGGDPAGARVSVVITNYNLGHHLEPTIARVAASTHPDVEVVVVDDASTRDEDRAVLGRLDGRVLRGDSRVRVVRNPVNRGLPGARNVGVAAASGRYVLPLDADDAISPGFISIAVRALEARPEYDVVVPSAAYFADDEALARREFTGYLTFLGDAPSLGAVANVMSCATALVRRSVFDAFRYDEALDSYEDWDLYLRLVRAGRRFLVTNGVHFHYRARPGSMIAAMSRERHYRLLERLSEAAATGRDGARLLPWVAACADAELGVSRLVPLPLRYRLVDTCNAWLRRTPVHAAAKRAASVLEKLVGTGRGAAR